MGKNGLPVLSEIAVSGAALRGNRLLISAGLVTYNGIPLLHSFPSHFKNELLSAEYTNQGATLWSDGQEPRFVHVFLVSLRVTIQVQLHGEHQVSMQMTANPVPSQDGVCGNFNGN